MILLANTTAKAGSKRNQNISEKAMGYFHLYSMLTHIFPLFHFAPDNIHSVVNVTKQSRKECSRIVKVN